jgi:hypothetical protein
VEGVALVAALPAKAQQVVLTPGGTAFQSAPQVNNGDFAQPAITGGKGGILGDQPLTEQPDGMILLGLDPNSPKVEVDNNPNPVVYSPGPQETQQEFIERVRSKAQFVLDNPGFVRPNELVTEVVDAQGKVLYTKDQVIETLRVEAEKVVRNPESYGIRNSALNVPDNPQPSVGSLMPLNVVVQDSYDKDGRLIQTKEQAAAEIRRETEIQALYPGRLGVYDGSTTFQSIDTVPVTVPALLPVASVTLPSLPAVTVQASQNPTADFATTRSAPRNTVPEQLNRGVVDSPLSNSRIFPGMR